MVFAHISGLYTVGGWGTLFEVPAEYMPSEQVTFVVPTLSNNRLVITTSGYVQVQNAISNQGVSCDACYLVDYSAQQ